MCLEAYAEDFGKDAGGHDFVAHSASYHPAVSHDCDTVSEAQR